MSGNMPGALPSSASQHSNSSSQSKPAPLSLEQSRQVARTHFDALKGWLQRQGALANAWTRSNAREKLTRLTRQQFQELSTDVYDELVRRSDEGAGQSMSKSGATSKVELTRTTSDWGHFSASHPNLSRSVPCRSQRLSPQAESSTTKTRNSTPPKVQGPRQQRCKPRLTLSPFRQPSQPSSSGGSHLPRSDSVSRSTSAASSSAPLQGTSPIPPPPTNLAQQRRAPTPLGLSQNSSNDVVVPNKSTLVIEESAKLPAPGGSNQLESSTPSLAFGSLTQHASAQVSSIASVPGASPSFSSGARMVPNDYGQDANRQQSPPNKPGHTAQPSEASSMGTRFIGGYGTSSSNDSSNRRNSWDHEAKEKLKADYEYKLTMLQSRIDDLEREVDGARGDLKTRSIEQARLRDLEDQLRGHRERNESQSLDMRNLRSELERLSNEAATRSRGDHDRAASDDLANELRAEVGSLVDELREVNAKYEDVVEGLNRERQAREKVEDDARMWKKKYEQTKTELRNLKATSQLFTATIKVDNDSFMSASPDGLLADVHISEFQTSIDDLLDAARSKEPSSVLTAARAIVAAVEKIDSDVQAIDPRRISALPPSEQGALAQTKDNIGATLSNLMTASKNHAMSFGVSPVSLVDAAASHVSTSVVELVRILKIRRTVGGGSGGRDLPSSSSNVTRGAAGGFEPMPSLSESPDVSNAPPPPVKQNGGTTVGSSWTGGMKSVKNVLGNFSLNRAASTTQQQQQQQAPTPVSSAAPERDSREGGMLPSSSSLGSLNFARTPPPASSHGFGGRAEPNSWDQQIVRAGAPSALSSDYPQHNPQTASPTYGGTSNAPMPNAYGRPSQHDDRFASPQPTAYNGSERVSPNSDFGGGYQDSRDDSTHQQQQHGRGSYDARDSYGDQMGQFRQGHEERNYIENQTEAIVHSIQSLLGAIRGGAQAEQLNENLTQIITIVSSIVAISRDALPLHSRPESEGILRDLAENCDRLSEMQSLAASGGGPNSTAFNKQTKQSMASASFGVAKSLKQLNGLLATRDDEENLL
ncbi:BQ5605_C002g01197 [Microbotryum silenes-dioicae]|uniref:BQ5605_C002g01197 protein n=1 Tax=Microbotryum silenes-dioicae TaxID=796604 RepID=A0A2X0MSW4_9BASI|nr:BQ5605_C002g01197 [Microbotryum silenes-dioicae]